MPTGHFPSLAFAAVRSHPDPEDPFVKLTRLGVGVGALACALALAACGSDNNNSSSTSSAAAGGAGSASSSSSAAAVQCAKGTLNADGSTAQANAMSQWIKDYQVKCPGTTINYSGGGSGQGVTDFTSGKVDFAGSDAALDASKGEPAAAAARCGSPALNLPMVVGPVGIAYNVKGAGDLTLTPSVLTQIFLGKITTWNDPAIAGIKGNSNLPSTPITVFYRSDQSGTTQNFESYLAATDPTDFSTAPSKTWSGKAGQGKTGSQGIQQGIQSTDGGIGYVEYSYVVNGGLKAAKIDNGGGAVTLNAKTAGNAVNDAQVVGTGNDLSLKLNYATKSADSYPIILVTYNVVCTKYAGSAKGALVKSFFTYVAGDGQQSLAQLGYAPLPSSIQSKVHQSVSQVG